MRKRAATSVRKALNSMPYGRPFDWIYNYALFLRAHGRAPRKATEMFVDYFFRLKNSREIESELRQRTSDKELVKEFVSGKVGPGYVLATLAVLTREEEIDAFEPDEPCVLKPTHLSGVVVFARPGNPLSEQDREILKKTLGMNLYHEHRERNYKSLTGRIVVERDISEREGGAKDYKVFCYMGRARFIQVDSNRFSGHRRNLYDTDWRQIPFAYNYPLGEWEPRPEFLPDLIRVSEILSADFESIRVDFFAVASDIVVGELTHVPDAAHGRFGDVEGERLVSDIFFGRRDGMSPGLAPS